MSTQDCRAVEMMWQSRRTRRKSSGGGTDPNGGSVKAGPFTEILGREGAREGGIDTTRPVHRRDGSCTGCTRHGVINSGAV